MAAKPNASWQEKVTAALKSDPKRTGILTILGVVLLGMWGKMLIGGKTGPTPAAAMTVAQAADPVSVISRRTSRNSDNSKLLEWVATPMPTSLQRNLFAINFDSFPKDPNAPTAPVVPSLPVEGFWDQLAKSMQAQTDEKISRETRVAEIVEAAGGLRLQSIVMGASPKALVNGGMVGQGDVVASGSTSFRVLKIEARRIVVEHEGIKLEILMK
jgi:hypothetical protein